MLTLFATSRTLIAYVLLALVFLVNPIGWVFLLFGLGCFFRIPYCLTVWYNIDVALCGFCHNTKLRTISGWTGQHLHQPRYKVQAKVIDFLAELCGDQPNHCTRVYHQEKARGLI